MRAKVLALTALALVSVLGAEVFAQTQPTPETIRVASGDTFEIGIDGPKDSNFSWVLTKDRSFLGAQRSRFYQTRFRDPGTYQLDVSVQSSENNFNAYRAFTIIVGEPVPLSPLPTRDATKAPKAVAVTDPITSADGVHLSKEGGVLKIDPSKSEGNVKAFHLDLDNNIDTDGNGNLSDDDDTKGTSFSSVGSPIYVATLPASAARSITLSVDDQQQTKNELPLPLIFDGAVIRQPTGSGTSASSPNGGPIPTSETIIQADIDGTHVRFAPILPESAKDKQIIVHWDFGDRAVSLLTTPEHTYRSGGTYIITVRVQDISDGKVLLEGSNSIQLQGSAQSSASSSSESSVITSSSSSNGSNGSSFPWGSIMKVLLIVLFLLAIAIGLYALIVWIKNKATGRLHETFEKMEKTIVDKDAVASGTVEPEPMKLARPAVPTPPESVVTDVTSPPAVATAVAPTKEERADSEGSKEFVTEGRTLEAPTANAGPVPPWLANADANSEPAPEPSLTPAPEPEPQAEPAPAPESESQPEPVPEPTPAPESVTPAPEPTPEPAPEPKPTPVAPPPSTSADVAPVEMDIQPLEKAEQKPSTPDSDQTIAIIKAEGISEDQTPPQAEKKA